MADIFISYASEDRSRVQPLARSLEEQGWSVFWDRTIPAGKTWRQVIGDALKNSRSVIVAWSKTSVESRWVQEEAERGLNRNVLIPILIDDVEPPLGFGTIQAADLITWEPTQSSPEFEKLIADISEILGPSPRHVKETEQAAEEERKRKQEEESKHKEEERRKAKEESQQLEIEQRRIAEEKRKRAEVERKAEEERKRKEIEAKRKADEERKRKEVEVEADRARKEQVEIKAEFPKTPPPEQGAIRPGLPEPRKKRNYFVIGAMITLVLAIVVGLALWSSRERTTREKGPVETSVSKTPEVPKPEVKPPEPPASQPKPVLKPVVEPPEQQAEPQKPVTSASAQRTFTNSIGMSFVLILTGSFTMGSPTGEGGREPDEKQHQVTISKAFWLQTTEVTQNQWTLVMGSNPSDFKNCGGDCPVEQVSWNGAQEFIRRLNQKEGGKGYRLPTEAEWEYACRAGSKARFCYGNDTARLGEYAWYFGAKPHPVGKKKPNDWGLYDMHGNVLEWCQDWYGDYPTSQVTDPPGPEAGKKRVARGGSSDFHAAWLRSAIRFSFKPDTAGNLIGFRVARDP